MDGPLSLAAWLFVPEKVPRAGPPVVIVAVPGGSYSKAYFHMEVLGHPGYSFAEHMACRGYPVLALDHLGIGDSTRPADGDAVRLAVMAAANVEAVRQMREAIAHGTLSSRLPPLPDARFAGVGHSMGGCITIMQQANHRSYDAVAILGWTNQHLYLRGPEAEQ